MKHIVFVVGLLMTGWMASVAAQQQRPTPPAEPAHNVFILTGCLEGGTAAPAFRLTGGAPVGQAPPPRAPGASESATKGVYELRPVSSFSERGLDRDRLEAHVGKRVQVTLRPLDTPVASPSPTASQAEAKPEETQPQRYTVIELHRLADSCK